MATGQLKLNKETVFTVEQVRDIFEKDILNTFKGQVPLHRRADGKYTNTDVECKWLYFYSGFYNGFLWRLNQEVL